MSGAHGLIIDLNAFRQTAAWDDLPFEKKRNLNEKAAARTVLARSAFLPSMLGGPKDLSKLIANLSRVFDDETAILTVLRTAHASGLDGVHFDIEIDGVPVRVYARLDSVEKTA